MTKVKRILPLFILLCGLLLLAPGCARLTYDITPDAHGVYQAITLRINVKVTEGKSSKRQGFKVLLKFDDKQDKMLFLSPINQVYGQLLLEKEDSLLINSRKKRFWRGDFRQLIEKIWALDFQYSEFKALVLEGAIPEEKVKQQGIRIHIEPGKKDPKPYRIRILYDNVTIKIKISSRKSGRGIINFNTSLAGMTQGSIEHVLQAEE